MYMHLLCLHQLTQTTTNIHCVLFINPRISGYMYIRKHAFAQ